MPWTLTRRDAAVVVEMNSSAVNKMNPAYFDDLHDALDRLEREHPATPMVLTARGATFSAGLDFEDVFPRFARGDRAEIAAWFERFRASILRVFTLPRRVVAAVNGNAFAGGLILALGCDHRVGAASGARFTLNEVAVGIPMPGVYIELVRYAASAFAAAEASLSCRTYDVPQALAAGFLHEVVAPEALLDVAVSRAAAVPPDAATAYAVTKRTLLDPVLDRVEGPGRARDAAAIDAVMSPDSVRAQAAALGRLKGRAAR